MQKSGRTESSIFFLFINSKQAAGTSERASGRKQASKQVYNAYHIAGDFRSGRRRQLRVMDRSASQLLIRFTNCLAGICFL